MILGALLALLPSVAAASKEGNVVLKFSANDMVYLYVSLALGVLAIAVGFHLRKSVRAMSPGSAKMQEVGGAIREGALAYLKKQFRTMAIFVVLIAIGLFFMYSNIYESVPLGIWIAVTFCSGVAASYIAGYTGMLMAVDANMRTAHAALTSYKQSLEVAFRSGAVAGMVTVGMGLIGATAIFLLAGADAMKLLIGFGFGGSLAALFMRVGGGIFTKAADVGADLVGKVEAGIPEDDPRNPATIADNVGDNVGDCAGMAADIFESYEVTLVAAIVLGAATSQIFDQPTWMKLILFALMARGVGIVASIIGIYSVRGSDNVDADPLKAIRKGFQVSAAVAIAGTAALAFFMMGGTGTPISTNQLKPVSQYGRDQMLAIHALREKIAKENKVKTWQVSLTELQERDELKAMGLDKEKDFSDLQLAISTDPTKLPEIPPLKGFSKVDFSDTTNPALNYTIQNPRWGSDPSAKQFATIKDAFGPAGISLGVVSIHVETTVPGQPAKDGMPASPGRIDKQDRWIGPLIVDDLNKQIKQAKLQDPSLVVNIKDTLKLSLYSNPAGALVFGLEEGVDKPQILQSTIAYVAEDVKTIENAQRSQQAGGAPSMPLTEPINLAIVQHKTVPWYMFFAAILFGILMAFAIELLTDYYVSTHKKPVQEVAKVSSAGPAPMIIQGFALGCESSVFSVFAIVVALMMPLFFFPHTEYGGYILSFYGIALVGLGLLTTTGYILAMDTFGPISDYAQGVFEMSGAAHESPEGAKAVQRLDAAGNTTKALTKGFAIATAVVAAVALFHAFLEDAHLGEIGLRLDVPQIFLGLLIGGAAPYLFSAFSINAVGRAAFQLINEVRAQFRNDPGIMKGTSKPNYGRCVAIVTEAAQKELLGPGILAIALPALVAFGFSIGQEQTVIGGQSYNLTGAEALGGFLAGAILSGQLMAVLLANSGGIWDNAKKLIEDGLHGGKGSEAHKAGIVCDTVGDPFKDTAGPALNPLIKVMNLVALLLAPVVIKPYGDGVLSVITIACLAALVFSIWWSKRSSLSDGLSAGNLAAAPAMAASTTPAPTPKKKILVEEEPTGEDS